MRGVKVNGLPPIGVLGVVLEFVQPARSEQQGLSLDASPVVLGIGEETQQVTNCLVATPVQSNVPCRGLRG